MKTARDPIDPQTERQLLAGVVVLARWGCGGCKMKSAGFRSTFKLARRDYLRFDFSVAPRGAAFIVTRCTRQFCASPV